MCRLSWLQYDETLIHRWLQGVLFDPILFLLSF